MSTRKSPQPRQQRTGKRPLSCSLAGPDSANRNAPMCHFQMAMCPVQTPASMYTTWLFGTVGASSALGRLCRRAFRLSSSAMTRRLWVVGSSTQTHCTPQTPVPSFLCCPGLRSRGSAPEDAAPSAHPLKAFSQMQSCAVHNQMGPPPHTSVRQSPELISTA